MLTPVRTGLSADAIGKKNAAEPSACGRHTRRSAAVRDGSNACTIGHRRQTSRVCHSRFVWDELIHRAYLMLAFNCEVPQLNKLDEMFGFIDRRLTSVYLMSFRA